MILTKCMYNIDAMKKESDNGLKQLEVIGFDGIPLESELNDIEKFIKENDIIIRSVHIPTTTIDSDIKVVPNIEYLENEVFRENCKAICKHFQSLSERLYNNSRIKVILHTKTRVREYKVLKSTYRTILNAIQELLEYKNIEICLENVPIVHYESLTDSLVGCFGCGLSFIDIAEKLSVDICTDRIKVLVDTCHAESHNAILKALKRDKEVMKLEEILKLAYDKGLLGQIHIASQLGLGIIPGEHGISLDLNETLSNDIVEAIKPYIDDDNIDSTIEVDEDSYPDCKNAFRSYYFIINRLKTK